MTGKTDHRFHGAFAAMALLLSACGAGTGGPAPDGDGSGTVRLGHAPDERITRTDMDYATGSHVFLRSRGDVRQIYIGADVEPKGRLTEFSTQDGIRYYIGSSRDGAGVERLRNYRQNLRSGSGDLKPFRTRPRLYFDSELAAPANRRLAELLLDSVAILNDALPPEYQISVVGQRSTSTAGAGEIMVSFDTASAIDSACGTEDQACARVRHSGSSTYSAVVHLPITLDTSEYRSSRRLVVHELLHALGIDGHVDSVEFPDSVMGRSGDHFPNFGWIVGGIDREALQIMYMSRETGHYNDWDEWTDTSFHLVARSEDGELNFGTGLFNGLPQPWVRGERPDSVLDDNHRLSGAATWSGSLLGFSGSSPIAGTVELEVRLATVGDAGNEQDLRLRDIYFLNRLENSDRSASSDLWFGTRNVDYKVSVSGNLFRNVRGAGYEPGHVIGAFFGDRHEHMGGTVKRTDMAVSFGGSR